MTSSIESMIAALGDRGDAIAITQLGDTPEDDRDLSYGGLHRRACAVASAIGREVEPGALVGLVASNSAAWIQADLGLLLGGFTEVPVPLGFSSRQAAHLLAPCRAVLVDEAGRRRLDDWSNDGDAVLARLHRIDIASLPAGTFTPRPGPAGEDWTCKVIHTSGTTSTPKGVRIRARALDQVIASLLAWTRPGDYARYLNLVPFSLLLEQITALYLPFAQSGRVVLPPASQPPIGEAGSSTADKLATMRRASPSAMTLTPSLVEGLAAEATSRAAAHGDALCRALFGRDAPPLIAAGGGPISRLALEALAGGGIEVLVGYGLSENSSVACWNRRGENRIGTVGRPLPHVECRLSAEGELGLRSRAAFAGYAGEDPGACALDDDGWLWTGDLAAIDPEGYVTITGRRKNLIISSHGRNVSPEFVEATYRQVAGVVDCVVFGDGEDVLRAFVVTADRCDIGALKTRLLVQGAAHLSVTERVGHFSFVDESRCPRARLFTITGRPRRGDIDRYMRESAGAFRALAAGEAHAR